MFLKDFLKNLNFEKVSRRQQKTEIYPASKEVAKCNLDLLLNDLTLHYILYTRPRRAVGNMADCRSRGREFDPGPVPYFRGD